MSQNINDLRLYHIPIDFIPINVVVYKVEGDDFVFVDFNKTAEVTENIKKESVIGKQLTDIFPGVKDYGLFEVLQRVYESGKNEVFDLKFYEDGRISGWRKNEIIKLPNGDVMAMYEDLTQEKQLEERVKKLNNFIDNSQTIVFFWLPTENWPVEYVSNNIGNLGYSVDDFLSKKIDYKDIVHPDDLERISEEVAEHTQNKNNKFTQVYRILTADGSIRWVDDRTIIERDSNGNPTYYLGTIVDITEQKALEGKLQLLGKLIDNSVHEIYMFDKDNLKFTYLNRGAEKNIGYTLQEIKNMTPVDIKEEYTKQQFVKALLPLRDASKDEITLDTTHQRKDGTFYNVEAHVQLIRVDESEQFVVIALDTTEKKKVELNLKESEEKFRTIAENSQMGIFIYRDKFTYVNQALTSAIGYSAEELYHISPWEILEKSMQDDIKDTMSKRLSGEKFPKEYQDLKFIAKSGEKKIIRVMTETIKYEDGYAGLGTAVDITDITQTKQKLKILAQAVEQTDELIMITDKNGTITYVNDAYVAQTGYKRNELIGKRPNILSSGEHENGFYKELWETINSGETYSNTVVNRKKNNQVYYEEKTITPLCDNNHILQNFVSTGRDITSRMNMEEELHKRATIDSLTGIFNRYSGNELIDLEIGKADRYKNLFSVLMLDIDNFKDINDRYGHDIGDYVLKRFSEIISLHIRKSDAFIRWGGEEFIIISSNLKEQEAISFAEKLKVAISSYEFKQGIEVTMSIGVTTSKNEDTKESILKRADIALYKAKEGGRNRVVCN
ncbi:MAG: PAS domain S-box protein [Campylobacterota bacterium]